MFCYFFSHETNMTANIALDNRHRWDQEEGWWTKKSCHDRRRCVMRMNRNNKQILTQKRCIKKNYDIYMVGAAWWLLVCFGSKYQYMNRDAGYRGWLKWRWCAFLTLIKLYWTNYSSFFSLFCRWWYPFYLYIVLVVLNYDR